MSKRVLRLPQVIEFTGIGKSSVYKGVSNGSFPKPIQLTERSVGWLESEVLEWLEARVAERDRALEAKAA